MGYRTVEIKWAPDRASQWTTYTAARTEAARLWGDLVARHHRLRRMNWRWPSKARFQKWAKGRYPGLSAQATQQIIGEFIEAVNATRQLRKNGHGEARYPWKRPLYRDVVYTNQDARIRSNRLVLPNGTSGTLRIPLPRDRLLPGRLMEARLCLGHVLLTCEIPAEARHQRTVVGVDLGVNTLIAATDGTKAVLISGREAKATVQWRNKRLASAVSRQSTMLKGSRRWRRVQRRKKQMLAKARRRMNDLIHKATHRVAQEFPGATCYVGTPFNDASRTMNGVWAQQVSQASNEKIARQLDYKTSGAIQVDEHYSSQTCPHCGAQNKCRRVYRCRNCGIVAPRDVVGSTNILCIGLHEEMRVGQSLATEIVYVRPVKVFRREPDSALGHSGHSAPRREAHAL